MFKLFTKEKHFFDSWESASKITDPFIPESGTIGSLRLGDRVDLIESMGKPNAYNQAEKNHYTLEYENLTLDCEDGFLTYIGCTFGEIEVKTAKNETILKGMNIDQVMERCGAPDQDDLEDLDDIVLSYTNGDVLIEFEFGSGQALIRVNCFRDPK
ncbi:MAG: hypothetical protein ACSHYA_13920 [Opitutaceae bacterium]